MWSNTFRPKPRRRSKIWSSPDEAFAARIDQLQWMTPETDEGKAKLATLKSRSAILTTGAIIRPWTSAAATPWVTSSRAELFEYHRNLAKLSNPVDRSEWSWCRRR